MHDARQKDIQNEHLVCEFPDTGAKDGFDMEVGDVRGVPRADVCQVQPHRMLAFGLQRPEQIVVHHIRQPGGSLAPLPLRAPQGNTSVSLRSGFSGATDQIWHCCTKTDHFHTLFPWNMA